MTCSRNDCFYCAKGACVSLSVLNVDDCGHFRHKGQVRRHRAPRRDVMAALRQSLEANAPVFTPRVQRIGATAA